MKKKKEIKKQDQSIDRQRRTFNDRRADGRTETDRQATTL